MWPPDTKGGARIECAEKVFPRDRPRDNGKKANFGFEEEEGGRRKKESEN